MLVAAYEGFRPAEAAVNAAADAAEPLGSPGGLAPLASPAALIPPPPPPTSDPAAAAATTAAGAGAGGADDLVAEVEIRLGAMLCRLDASEGMLVNAGLGLPLPGVPQPPAPPDNPTTQVRFSLVPAAASLALPPPLLCRRRVSCALLSLWRLREQPARATRGVLMCGGSEGGGGVWRCVRGEMCRRGRGWRTCPSRWLARRRRGWRGRRRLVLPGRRPAAARQRRRRRQQRRR